MARVLEFWWTNMAFANARGQAITTCPEFPNTKFLSEILIKKQTINFNAVKSRAGII